MKANKISGDHKVISLVKNLRGNIFVSYKIEFKFLALIDFKIILIKKIIII